MFDNTFCIDIIYFSSDFYELGYEESSEKEEGLSLGEYFSKIESLEKESELKLLCNIESIFGPNRVGYHCDDEFRLEFDYNQKDEKEWDKFYNIIMDLHPLDIDVEYEDNFAKITMNCEDDVIRGLNILMPSSNEYFISKFQ